jgi:hypothetical protein
MAHLTVHRAHPPPPRRVAAASPPGEARQGQRYKNPTSPEPHPLRTPFSATTPLYLPPAAAAARELPRARLQRELAAASGRYRVPLRPCHCSRTLTPDAVYGGGRRPDRRRLVRRRLGGRAAGGSDEERLVQPPQRAGAGVRATGAAVAGGGGGRGRGATATAAGDPSVRRAAPAAARGLLRGAPAAAVRVLRAGGGTRRIYHQGAAVAEARAGCGADPARGAGGAGGGRA